MLVKIITLKIVEAPTELKRNSEIEFEKISKNT